MSLLPLLERPDLTSSDAAHALYNQFNLLLTELNKAKLTHHLTESINEDIAEINAATLPPRELNRLVKSKQTKILKALEKELKVVPKNYYRNLWLALGMTVFGLPLGVAMGMSLGNIALLGIGLPIGMVIGMLVGTNLDNKAREEGRQLDIELKH